MIDSRGLTVDQGENSAPLTLVISEVVRPDRIQEYESWVKDFLKVVEQYDGFVGVDVLRPGDHTHPEYVIIVIFKGFGNLKNFQESASFDEWLSKAQEFIVGEAHIQKAAGYELWFTLPDESRFMPKPAYYKMVIVSTIAVFSLVLIVGAVLGPLIEGLPFLLSLLISITAVSALMTYPVLPFLTHWLNFWLYPTSANKTASN